MRQHSSRRAIDWLPEDDGTDDGADGSCGAVSYDSEAGVPTPGPTPFLQRVREKLVFGTTSRDEKRALRPGHRRSREARVVPPNIRVPTDLLLPTYLLLPPC